MKILNFKKSLCVAATTVACLAIVAAANPGLTRSLVAALPQGSIKSAASSLLPAGDIYLTTPQECISI